MQDYTLQNFQPHLGSVFQIMINGQPALDLTLAEVEALKLYETTSRKGLRTEPFSLIFNGPLQKVADQMIYDLNHAQLGNLQLFLVPVGPDRETGKNMQYQAVFN